MKWHFVNLTRAALQAGISIARDQYHSDASPSWLAQTGDGRSHASGSPLTDV